MVIEPIEGKFVRLRIANEEDAEFTLAIRRDDKNTKYIPRLEVDLDRQKEWLNMQRESGDCYFFVVERLTGEKIGTYCLYNIQGDRAESGRAIIRGNQIETLETGLLFSDFAFEKVGVSLIYCEIESENYPALGLNAKFGGKKIEEFVCESTGKKMFLTHNSREDYYYRREKLERLVERFQGRM